MDTSGAPAIRAVPPMPFKMAPTFIVLENMGTDTNDLSLITKPFIELAQSKRKGKDTTKSLSMA